VLVGADDDGVGDLGLVVLEEALEVLVLALDPLAGVAELHRRLARDEDAVLVVLPVDDEVDEDWVLDALLGQRPGGLRERQGDVLARLVGGEVDGDHEEHQDLEDEVEQRREVGLTLALRAAGAVAHRALQGRLAASALACGSRRNAGGYFGLTVWTAPEE